MTGAAKGPELSAVLAALPRDEALARAERAASPEYDRPMRLYDSLTRGLVELPPPPGPIRIYVCGSTVYQRVHVGNSRPFVLGMWLRSWLRRTGYDVTLVHNITDVDDKVYAEAVAQGIPSRELSERATRLVLRGHG